MEVEKTPNDKSRPELKNFKTGRKREKPQTHNNLHDESGGRRGKP